MSETPDDSSFSWDLAPTHSSPQTPSVASSNRTAPAAPLPSGPLPVNNLSVTSWRTPFPRISHFAATETLDEVVAAGPDGLFYFRQVQDHASRPWSEPQPFPDMPSGRLDTASVSGIALQKDGKNGLHVHYAANGFLHSFYRDCSIDKGGGKSWTSLVHPCPIHRASGTPAAAMIHTASDSPRLGLFVPSQTGGLLFTSLSEEQNWGPVEHVATDLGIISAVSAIGAYEGYIAPTVIVAVCIASGRLHAISGNTRDSYHGIDEAWKVETSASIQHPGEVTGNPALINCGRQLDLLVPSAEGGIFHFVRTPSSLGEWHMIGRIGFPEGVPMAASLALARHGRINVLAALVQCGGRLYHIKTTEAATPWRGSRLNPIVTPGPFYD